MNLFELKEEIGNTQADIDYYKDEIERLEAQVGVGSIDPAKEIIRGGLYTREDALLELTQMEMYLDEACAKLNNLSKLKNKKYSNYKKSNNYDKQIYIEKKLFKWSNAKISARHNGISRTQIWNIVNKIENSEQK